MKKMAVLMAALLAGSVFGRVGPVSAYGQLQAGTNSSGKGQIYGSCKGVSDGNEVAVQGMSLFWSIASDVGAPFWSDTYVSGLVEKQNIQLIRAPMGVDETWGDGTYFSKTTYYQDLMDTVVQSAIDNDIYVIIDFHSHCAENITENAKTFFATMAEKWGKYDNVIFEIYNEPKNACSDTWFELSGAQSYWSNTIYPYAESVISTIRQYSDNLILVGTPYFDQYTNAALAKPLSDANVAYTFHYYAGDDEYAHTTSKQGSWAEAAMNGGLSVFVSEWGNSAPSGNGGFNSSNSTTWYNWMKSHKLSGANWSVSNKGETASYFTTDGAWNYSESGKWVNANVFASLPASYTACSNTTTSSSSVAASSSSVAASSSAIASSSSVVTSSSAVASSSSVVTSSSAVASSSSVVTSSSAVASSASVVASSSSAASAAGYVISGSTSQTVAKNSALETITITNVTSFNRDTWNLASIGNINFAYADNTVTISGTVGSWAAEGSYTETITVNGETLTFDLTIVAEGTTSVDQKQLAQPLNVSILGKTLHVASKSPVDVEIFDMQGCDLKRFSQVRESVSLESMQNGSYIVRLRSGSMSRTLRIVLR